MSGRESKAEESLAEFDSAAFLEEALDPDKAKGMEGIFVVAPKESAASRKTGRVGVQTPLSIGLILLSSISS